MSADKAGPSPAKSNSVTDSQLSASKSNIVNDARPVDNNHDADAGEACALSENTVATLPNDMSALSISSAAPRYQNELTNYRGGERSNSQIINIVGGNEVHIGPNIMIPALFAQTTERNCEPKIPKTRTIDSEYPQDVDLECIQLVAENLGKGWQSVLRRLGHTDAFIEQIDRDFQKDGTKEIIYQGLRAWMRNADDDQATISVLMSVLWRNGHKACVVRLKDWFKNRSRSDP